MVPCADPYADLGLTPDADESAIRNAFRRLAFELHPDRNPDPAAAESFRRMRSSYEALLDPSHRQAAEAEAVVASMMRAATEAARTRVHPVQELGSTRFALRAGPRGLAPVVAGRVAAVLTGGAVLAFGLAVLASPAFALIAGMGAVAAPAVWLTRRRPSDLLLYGNGFADSRWPAAGRIGWADVSALDPDYGAGLLDVALSEAVADRLLILPGRPRGTLVWQGARPFYRLSLGTETRAVVTAMEARSGLSAHASPRGIGAAG